jgi:hypothetical protein
VIEQAKQRIESGQCSVAAVTADGEILMDSGTTVRPLYRLFVAHRERLKGACVADKIIGRAAASLLCAAGVREVYAFLMSRSGLELLEQYGVKAGYAELTPMIVNRKGTDMCPMEKTVDGVEDLEECVRRLGEFIARVAPPK